MFTTVVHSGSLYTGCQIGHIDTVYVGLLMYNIYTTVDACAYLHIFILITTCNTLFYKIKKIMRQSMPNWTAYMSDMEDQ